MDWYLIIKTIHIITSTVLFGTGLGTAFFFLCSHFTDNLHEKFFAARSTVLADYVFTAPAVILQPLSGAWLIWKGGFDPTAPWLMWTYGIYVLAGLCWLPVVWIQIQLKQMVHTALDNGTPLPDHYHGLLRIWFILGWPAFLGLVAIFFLMVVKPS